MCICFVTQSKVFYYICSGNGGPYSERLSRTNSLPNLQGVEHQHGRGSAAPLEIGFSEELVDVQFGRNPKGSPQENPYLHQNVSSKFVPSLRKNITGPSPCPSEPSYSSNYQEDKLKNFPNATGNSMRRHQSQNIIPTGPPKPPRDPKRMSGELIFVVKF